MTRAMSCFAVFIGIVSHCGATITVWSGTAGNVTINVITGDVTINAAGTYKLQSVTAGSLDNINSIKVANGVTGAVTIHVARNPDDSAGTLGAHNVDEINLTNDQATLTGDLAELRITGELGMDQPTVAANITGAVIFDTTARDITVGTNLNGNITATTVGNVTVVGNNLNGNITATTVGNVTVLGNDMTGDITATTIGNITVHDDMIGVVIDATSVGNVTTEINGGFFSGSLTTTSLGNLSIEGQLNANITILGPYSGGWHAFAVLRVSMHFALAASTSERPGLL